MHYAYILVNQDENRESYIGVTSDLRRRVKAHNDEKNRSTRGRNWGLIYYKSICVKTRSRETGAVVETQWSQSKVSYAAGLDESNELL